LYRSLVVVFFDRGIEIPEAWMPTIKKHNNRRTVQQRTTEGTATRQNNGTSEDQNAPIKADLCDINDTVQSVDLIA